MTDLSAFPITRKWPALHPERIQLYSLPTPNGVKVAILLEETGLAYEPHRVSFDSNDQKSVEFLSLNPYGKIPAIIDPDGPDGEPIALFESGAILLYLAGKTGQFMPTSVRGKYETLEWLMFQMGGVGPMLGQAHHFRLYAPEKIAYAVDRYTNEARRLYGVMDKRLGQTRFLAGSEYTIADIATWPWTRSHQNQGIDLDDFPNVKRWFDTIAARAAAQRGVQVLDKARKALTDDKAREMLFGAGQYAKR